MESGFEDRQTALDRLSVGNRSQLFGNMNIVGLIYSILQKNDSEDSGQDHKHDRRHEQKCVSVMLEEIERGGRDQSRNQS